MTDSGLSPIEEDLFFKLTQVQLNESVDFFPPAHQPQRPIDAADWSSVALGPVADFFRGL